MLEVKDLTIMIDGRFLIKNLTFSLDKGDKLAIIGEEGNGKSTLLKALLGACDYAEINGSINQKGNRIGYLEQSIQEDLNKLVYDYLFRDENHYYEKISDFYRYLDTMHLTDKVLEQKIATLSGGESVKVRILKLLLNDEDILFLDEPTNDLDIETLEWLEKFIQDTSKPIIYVSHDETLLSNTANRILHLEQTMKKTDCRYTLLKINYDEYVESRLRKIEKQTCVAKFEKREFNKQQEKLRDVMNKVEYQQNSISRGDPHGAKLLKKKMHSLKSQEKKLNQMQLTEMPDIEEQIYFQFENILIPQAKKVITIHILELKAGDKVLSLDIKFEAYGSDHICIMGTNGIGKSTLIKEIYEKLKSRSDIKIGYMPQSYEDILSSYEYVLDFLVPSKNQEEITKARKYLGNMKFTREEMLAKIKDLSNGMKAKLFLTKFVLDECNVLILDEPTRNLSPLSNPVIRKVLKEYKGCIISVSHDRKYMEEVVDILYEFTPHGLIKK